MLPCLYRCLLFRYSNINKYNKVIQFSSKTINPSATISKRGIEQVELIRTAIEDKKFDWSIIKSNVLALQGQLNQKNFEGVMLKILISGNHIDAALSFANHLKSSVEELSLGSLNGMLGLYYEIGKTRTLSNEEEKFILDTYNTLYNKYKVLDSTTSERLIRALCTINDYEKALKVLENIHLTSVPSHSAYSIIIGTLFKNNKKKKALELIHKSVEDKRPLQYFAFNEWINYIFRKYKENKTMLKHLDEIYLHISRNYVIIDEKTALKLKESFELLGWSGGFTKVRKNDGQCIRCKEKLDQLQLSHKEFLLLQQNVKEKLLVGSNLFLKTSPEELKKFSTFVENNGPYDIIIDSLNVAYAVGKGNNFPANRLSMLIAVVDYFKERNKKILLLGRKHMLKWSRRFMEQLTSNNCSYFLTDNLSEDDPFFITAAILSGPNTDIVSKDLLRGHTFLLQDEQLRYIFRRWQWQHQWMCYALPVKGLKIQAPLSFTPCAQKNKGGWHLPFESEEARETKRLVNDGTPDLSSWLCIKPSIDKINVDALFT